jgi:hypothetical protein
MPQVDSEIPADAVASYARAWAEGPKDMASVRRRIAGLFDGGQSSEFYRGMMNAFTAMMMLTRECEMLEEAPELAATFCSYLAHCRATGKTPGT